jgi:hypothetical protein
MVTTYLGKLPSNPAPHKPTTRGRGRGGVQRRGRGKEEEEEGGGGERERQKTSYLLVSVERTEYRKRAGRRQES